MTEPPDKQFADASLVLVPYLLAGLAASLPLLLVPQAWDLMFRFVAQLSLLVALGFVATLAVLDVPLRGFFRGRGWSRRREALSGAVVLVVLVTGVVALVTLASSAALRLTPSLQFLQLLSALDIAWVVAAISIGARQRWGGRAAVVSGTVIGVACVVSIWNYLRVVGFSSDGGWLVDGAQLMKLVIPFDMAAAVVAVTVLFLGIRHSADDAGQ